MLRTASGAATGGCAASRRRLVALVRGHIGSISAASIRQPRTFSSWQGRLSPRAFSSRIDLSTPCAFSRWTTPEPVDLLCTIVSAASGSVGGYPAAFATTIARLVGAHSTSSS
ncbi:hypothetical protein GN244_ATG12662 [Phytophthora infestans]|uniref:Uncharacterized protein n=1 Tax=Phytophthora infestans TaxID=4787 RepID=A0A833T813_PHYIN|nr:hypothetical protein GN244_ATG12662 [Phytophthora infestans]